MTILGIDTATLVTAVGVRRGGKVVSEFRETTRGGHAASLPRLVDEALARADVRPGELDGIGVSEGPGSFTGLRVGVSFAKGMAYVTGVTLTGVPTLRALARATDAVSWPVAVCLDARRGEVYLAAYEEATLREIEGPLALAPEAAVEEMRRLGVRTVLGDAAGRYVAAFAGLDARILDLEASPPSGAAVAAEAEERLREGKSVSPAELVPRYVRASEAEVRRREAALTREKTL